MKRPDKEVFKSFNERQYEQLQRVRNSKAKLHPDLDNKYLVPHMDKPLSDSEIEAKRIKVTADAKARMSKPVVKAEHMPLSCDFKGYYAEPAKPVSESWLGRKRRSAMV